MLTHEQIERLFLKHENLEDLANLLIVGQANKQGGKDNITVILVKTEAESLEISVREPLLCRPDRWQLKCSFMNHTYTKK